MAGPIIPLVIRGGAALIKRLARKKVLSKAAKKKLEKKAKKVGQKAKKKEGTPPFAKEISKVARKEATNPPLKEGLKAGKDLKREKDFLKGIEDRISKRVSARKPGQPGEGKPRSKRRKDTTKLDRQSVRITDNAKRKAGEEVSKKAKEARKNLKDRKRKRELKEDAKKRRN